MPKVYNLNLSLEIAKSKIFTSLLDVESENIFDVIDLSSGDYLPVSKMEDGQIKVYGGGGLTSQKHSKPNVLLDTIGIGRVGARCGCVFSIKANSWVTDNALYVSKFKKEYDLDFLIHFLNYCNINSLANTAAQPVISLRRIAKITVPKIDKSVQTEIATALNKIENGLIFFEHDTLGLNESLQIIENTKLTQTELQTQQNLLTKLRQSVLQEAVQGKLTERWRAERNGLKQAEAGQVAGSNPVGGLANDYQTPTESPVTPGGTGASPVRTANQLDETGIELLARIRAEKAELIRQGKLRKEKPLPPITDAEKPFDIPEGWVWCRLGEIAFNIFDGPFGSHLTSKDYVSQGIQVVRLENIGSMKFIEDKTAFISESKYQSLKKHTLYSGDVLFSSFIGEEVRACLLPAIPFVAINKADCFCVRLEHDAIVKKYLLLSLTNKYTRASLYHSIHGIARPRINLSQLRAICVPLPPYEEQQSIVAQVEAALRQVSALEDENWQQQEEVGRLMQAVLREAFAGKEKIAEAE